MRLRRLLTGSILFVLGSAVLFGQPAREGLIQAWERALRNDSETITFEKRGERSYHFSTKRFPFDGELKLLQATVDDRFGSERFVTGTVEVELVGLSDKIRQDYAHSYALWMTNNILYYDADQKRWLKANEFQAAARSKLPGSSFSAFWSWGPSILFLLVLFFIVLLLGRVQRKQKSYMARIERSFELSEKSAVLAEKSFDIAQSGLRLSEDSNRVLKEILETLRKDRGVPERPA